MKYPWPELTYWNSGEFQVVQDRLKDLEKKNIRVNPDKKNMFKALELTPFDKVRVAFISQDPYPEAKYANGVAFSIPSNEPSLPPSLVNILTEYVEDLHYPYPDNGDLSNWCKEGVLLWNAIPSCTSGKPGSHRWHEWTWLTREIVQKLSKRCIVFVFIGSIAKEYAQFVDPTESDMLFVAHPSPRNALNKNIKNAFNGSRIFSTVNDRLCSQGLPPINWRL